MRSPTNEVPVADPSMRIRVNLHAFDSVYLRIAQWLLARMNESAVNITTGEVAKNTATSRTTVVRFCQYLGYKGFSDFKTAWIQELAKRTGSGRPTSEKFPAVASRVLGLTISSIYETTSIIGIDRLMDAVQALVSASSVYYFGCGDSAALALSAEHKTTRVRKSAKAITDLLTMTTIAGMISPSDVVVLISQSGRWKDVVDALRPCQQRGTVVIAITSQVRSPIAQAADILLLTAARDITVEGKPFTFRAPQSMLLDMLILEMAERLEKSPSIVWSEPTLLNRT